jgi:DNA-binding transcriptional LysR family regulator
MPPVTLPPLGALQALTALNRDGSLAAAAVKLGVSRSALSHRIADLEERLGVALVRREGRRIRLTDEGETLMASLGDSVERIEAAIRPLQRRRLQVRVSTVATFASNWLIPRLASFHHMHPAIEIAVATTVRAVDLATEDIDLAIRHGRGRWEGLQATLLFRETLIPVVASAGTDTRDLKRIWRSATTIHARSREHDWLIWRHRKATPLSEGRKLIVENRAQALDAALAGNGIALVDAAYVGPLIAEGRLRPLVETPLLLDDGYYAVHRPAPRNPRAVCAFRDWLVTASGSFRRNSETVTTPRPSTDAALRRTNPPPA